MVFELVHGLFSRDSVLRSWTPEPTMGNGASVDHGGHTTHGTRDGSEAVESERYYWSELARAPITKQPISLLSTDRNFYTVIIANYRCLLLRNHAQLRLAKTIPAMPTA